MVKWYYQFCAIVKNIHKDKVGVFPKVLASMRASRGMAMRYHLLVLPL
jgi:hypothetical protein